MTKPPNIIIGAVGLGRGGIWVIRKQPKPRRKSVDIPCCLYPWPDPDGISGGPYYPHEDLPFDIDVIICGTPVLFETDGGYGYGSAESIDAPGCGECDVIPHVAVLFSTGGDANLYNWEIIYDDGHCKYVNPNFDPFNLPSTSCLIADYYGGFDSGCCSGPVLVRDRFSNTYIVTIPAGLCGDDAVTIPVTRVSSCVWEGASTILQYIVNIVPGHGLDAWPTMDNPNPPKPAWNLEISGCLYYKGWKIDPQNSPAGTYIGAEGITVA